MGLEPDTIVARATAPGIGAIGVVRISGPASRRILCALLKGDAVPEVGRPAPRWLYDPTTGARLDRAVVTFRAAPASYTGEDTVELSCHGSPLVVESVAEACRALGARTAEGGEFTRRAYLHGKLDLVQVEAVGDLVTARTPALRDRALSALDRGLSERIAALRARVVHLHALMVHHLDFPEEDDAPVPAEQLAHEGAEIAASIETLLATAPQGELLREGALAVLAGAPNAGKSTLFNALLGRERAIVTGTPGTTRDALEADVQIGGFPFRLVDTAGLRKTDEPVERLGVEVAERYLEKADVVLFCSEAGRDALEAERAFEARTDAPILRVRTMVDRGSARLAAERRERAGKGSPPPPTEVGTEIEVSARTGEGLDRLSEALARLAFGGLVSAAADAPVVTRARQRRGLERARREVRAFVDAVRAGVPIEMASTHLRPAETALEELLGLIHDEEVLDHLFAEFCIGK